ncbi:hypothetical protein A4A52_07460 [Haemophilus influenzae]|nr:hypothetical protein AC248_01840 [Haemophilus influenzae]ORJ35174.1 hypothetical protein A4A52_07460 [Haemophilus influenzae]ORJ40794.1 hypothetical protein A4A64_07315 [Haemophilus influenzae]
MVQLISEFFAHIEGDVIFLAWASIGAFGNDEVVLILDEAIFVDAVFDPISVLLFAFYECVKFTGVAKSNRLILD